MENCCRRLGTATDVNRAEEDEEDDCCKRLGIATDVLPLLLLRVREGASSSDDEEIMATVATVGLKRDASTTTREKELPRSTDDVLQWLLQLL